MKTQLPLSDLSPVPSAGDGDSGGEKAGSWTADKGTFCSRTGSQVGGRRCASRCLSNWQPASHGINYSPLGGGRARAGAL